MPTYPTINMNGTSRKDLTRQNVEALTAIRGAIAALARATPHGRDYIPQGGDEYRKAAQEHRERMKTMDGIADEIEAIAANIMEQ